MARTRRTLVIDVGGSHIKAGRLDSRRRLLDEPFKIDTPPALTPRGLVETLVGIAGSMDGYDRVSVGVNGLVYRGSVYAIPVTSNPAFRGLDLAARLARRLERPVRVLNDAQMHGLGFIRGRGVEVAITLGTGLGSALFIDGTLGPHLQFLPGAGNENVKGGDYGDRALASLGRRRWTRRVERLIQLLRRLTNFDHLYIGGGNAELLGRRLGGDVTLGDNSAALAGGVRMWEWDVR
jgi:polyphosphate glucokinase